MTTEKPMKTAFALASLFVLAVGGCVLGSQILDVGKPCTSDKDCSEDTECVRSDSPNASRVCMPFDDEGGASE